jgi:hypothetical protein
MNLLKILDVLYLGLLVAGFSPRRAEFSPRSGLVGFVVDNVAVGRFSRSTLVYPVNSYSTDFSTLIIIYHPGLAQ